MNTSRPDHQEAGNPEDRRSGVGSPSAHMPGASLPDVNRATSGGSATADRNGSTPEASLEICVDSISGLQAAWRGGADRIELCSALALGGLTPTAGLIALSVASVPPVYVMIRPRSGDFVFSADEEEMMHRDIDAVATAFATCPEKAGLVLGASLSDGRLDTNGLDRLLRHARSRGLPRATLHRAFDLTPDPAAALEEAIQLGFERILTSGCAKTALAGANTLRELHIQAAGRIAIMAGGGLSPENAARFMAATRINQLHASCREPAPAEAADPRAIAFGFGARPDQTSAARVQAMRAIVTSATQIGTTEIGE